MIKGTHAFQIVYVRFTRTYFVIGETMMSNEQENGRVPSAPSYNALFNEVAELRAQLQQLQDVTNRSFSAVTVNSQPVSDFRIMPDLNQSVKKFTGRENIVEATDWLDTVEGLANLNNWPWNFRLQFIRANMTGAARSWMGGEEFTDWIDFNQKFRRIFVRQTSVSDRWDLMKARVQNRDEPILEFYLDKVRLCKDLSLPFTEIRDHVLQSLYSRDLALYALGRTHKDSIELLADLQDWQRLTDLRNTRFAVGNSQSAGRFKTKIDRVQTHEEKKASDLKKVDSATTVLQPKSSSEQSVRPSGNPVRVGIKCYNCNGLGHMSRDCLKPKRPVKCSYCHADDHTRGKCPQSEAPPVQGYLVSKRREVLPHNTYVKPAYINDKQFQAMIDTGCSVTLIRSSAAIRTGAKLESNVKPLFVVGDMEIPGMATLGSMVADITIGQVTTIDNQICIVPDKAIPTDLLIGRNWLDLPAVNYYKLNNELIIAPMTMDLGQIAELPRCEYNACADDVKACLVSYWRADQILKEDRQECTQSVYSSARPYEPITISEVRVGEEFNEYERQQLIQTINEYRDVFAKSLGELGCTDVLKMDIPERPGSVPVQSKPYRTTIAERKIIADTLQEWRDNKIISNSSSSYASPVLLVNKLNGEKRLCIDYRKLNRQTICRPYLMPDIDRQLSVLSEGNIFTALDLSNGFLQIPLSEEAKDKTAFVTEDETARFERMPFGLCGAPGEFQKLMNLIFRELMNKNIVGLYLDDIILPALDCKDLLIKLRMVFEVLRKAKLTLKPSKCIFGAQELDYLGFRISKGKVQPGRKVSAITGYPTPKNVHEVRQFLGLAGFFRRFIQNYAVLARPITALTRKEVKFIWNTEQQQAFEILKQKLSERPVLRMYSPTAKVTEIHTDASAQGLAGMMLQGESTSDLHMVYCVSKTTTNTEQNYHSSKLELYAIIWTLGRLRHLLLGIKFTILTDCQALVYPNIHKTTKPQVARWFDTLHEFDFEIKYRPGSQMAHVDALSRTTEGAGATSEPMDAIFEGRYEVCLTVNQIDRIRFMQQGDATVAELVKLLNESTP